MSDMPSETAIVRAIADRAAKRITRKTIAALQRRTDTTSGDDSELKTIWDEICTQVQYEESILWDAYDQTARAFLRSYIEELPREERDAIWLQTDEGVEWDCEEPTDREAYPVVVDHIVDYLAREYLYTKAGRWSNARIRAFIERSSMRD